MYQRLGLEDDIVDPSNALLREGPVLKISFRRRDPTERYLFLVGEAGCHTAGPAQALPTGGAGKSLLAGPLLWPQRPPGLGTPSCGVSQTRPGEPQRRHLNPDPWAPKPVV